MLAFELDPDYRPAAADIVTRALREQRLVLNATGPTTVRLLPPLVIAESQADDAIGRLRAIVH
jgi:acetylornithine/N-succinyldiaminopimelate aminotransferase